MSFESDLADLRQSLSAAPSRQMLVRHERRVGPSASTVQLVSGSPSGYSQVVALYDISTVKGSRPVVVAEVDPSADLSEVPQHSVATVHGWPVVGRAVVIDINGVVLESIYPCVSPVIRAMRF